MVSKYRIVMARHGESEWNLRNVFCGWYDAPLSDEGRKEATQIGEKLRGSKFDLVFTSLLRRSYDSAIIIMETMGQCMQLKKSWQLNERHYGALTGFNKVEIAEQYGLEQTQVWRRSFDIPPPPMTKDHKYYKEIVSNPIFAKNGIEEKDVPETESLKTVMMRCIPFWNDVVVPQIKKGRQILVIAHGTSLRGLVKHIENISDEEITETNIPTGIPFSYEFDKDMKPLTRRKYMSDDETIRLLELKVANIANK